jgi:hypothetical protein
MFADGRLVLLTHKAGVELEQLQSSFQASPCLQTTYGRLDCELVLRVTVLTRVLQRRLELGASGHVATHSDFHEYCKGFVFYVAVHLLTYG